ncbi:hypothetical protein FRC05_003797 [Tulasnella sp. 425]|nr:hypothetical protein FRC05_003797 [Tulasnella sp. 425]
MLLVLPKVVRSTAKVDDRATISGQQLLSDRSMQKRLGRKNMDLSAVLEAIRGQGRRAENGRKTMAQPLVKSILVRLSLPGVEPRMTELRRPIQTSGPPLGNSL